MGSRLHGSVVFRTFIAVSMVLMLTALTAQASASHFGSQENTCQNRTRSISTGFEYAVHIDGTAKILGTTNVKPVSADLELVVLNVKTTGIFTVYFAVSGIVTLGGVEHELVKGNAALQVNKMTLRATSEDGTRILVLYGTTDCSIPIKIGEYTKLSQGQDRKSATFQVMAEKWTVSFAGTLARVG
jgi:hypothetical protein